MASIHKRSNGYQVRWRDPDGRQRGRLCPDLRTATRLRREVEATIAAGRRWEPAALRPVPDLGAAMKAYLAEVARLRAPRTVEAYASRLDLLLTFLREERGRRKPVLADLSRDTLSEGWAWLRSTGRFGQRSIHRTNEIVATWYTAWCWLADSDDYGDETPRPRRIKFPQQPRAIAPAPTWADVDAMIAALEARPMIRQGHDWERRIVLLARYTGARHLALLRLQWSDVELDDGRLHLRAESTKGRSGGRTVPLHPALAVELAGWGVREGPVVDAPHVNLKVAESQAAGVIREAWAAAGVRREVWHRRPVHCMRRGLRTHLIESGVSGTVADLLLGHKGRSTGDRVYTDPGRIWPRLVEAVATIPEVGASEDGDARKFEIRG